MLFSFTIKIGKSQRSMALEDQVEKWFHFLINSKLLIAFYYVPEQYIVIYSSWQVQLTSRWKYVETGNYQIRFCHLELLHDYNLTAEDKYSTLCNLIITVLPSTKVNV